MSTLHLSRPLPAWRKALHTQTRWAQAREARNERIEDNEMQAFGQKRRWVWYPADNSPAVSTEQADRDWRIAQRKKAFGS